MLRLAALGATLGRGAANLNGAPISEPRPVVEVYRRLFVKRHSKLSFEVSQRSPVDLWRYLGGPLEV